MDIPITPDSLMHRNVGPITLNATIFFTWGVMVFMIVGSWLVTRRVSTGTKISRWQNLLEIIVGYIRKQINEMTRQKPDMFLPFLGTLFLFIAVCNILSIVPRYEPPTGSLSTTTALAVCVFVSVPIFGIVKRGLLGYLKQYIRPSPFMLPFNIIGEVSRTLALAVRLFGNVMSGTLIAAILIRIVPLIFPAVMQGFGMLIGIIQAYIFAVLATVYIGAATRIQEQKEETKEKSSIEQKETGEQNG
jgi:F-type H+-transporting ATPase subunit a